MYNGALRALGQSKLSTLTDAVDNRYLLDGVWDENLREDVLAMGNWNFAIRAIKSEYDSSVSSPDFGFQRAFTKPTDWVRTTQLASDEYFINPLTDLAFYDEQGYWWADLETIYVRYVSSDTSYGYDLSLWPQSFVRYVESYFALQIAPKVLDRQGVIDLEKKTQRLLLNALSKDALNEGAKFHPPSGWASARHSGPRGDLGSRRRLLG